MSGDYLVIGRFCLGLLLIGGLYLWVRLMRNLDRLPPAVDCLLASRIHYGLAGGIVGYTALPELQALFAEAAVLGVVFFGGWFGLGIGLGLDVRILRRGPFPAQLLEMSQVGLVGVLVLLAAYVPGRFLEEGAVPLRGAALLMLCGVCAAGIPRHDRSGTELKAKLRRGGWPPVLSACAGIGLAGLGSVQLREVPFAVRLPFAPPSRTLVVEGLGAELLCSLVLGAITGLVLDLLTRGADRVALFYLAVSGLALGSGIAAVLGLEPLWVGLVAGAWLINATLRRLDILDVAGRSHHAMKIGLYFTAGWWIGHGMSQVRIDMGMFIWVLVLIGVLQPIAHVGGLQVALRLVGRGALKRFRGGVSDWLDLDDLGVVVAVGLAGLLEETVGLAVLAGVLVGKLALRLVGGWLRPRTAVYGEAAGGRQNAPPAAL